MLSASLVYVLQECVSGLACPCVLLLLLVPRHCQTPHICSFASGGVPRGAHKKGFVTPRWKLVIGFTPLIYSDQSHYILCVFPARTIGTALQ